MNRSSNGKERVIRILMKRDGMSHEETATLVDAVVDMVCDAADFGDDAEEIWMSELGLEPDYMIDCLI